jgi:hypothetical protein
LWRDAGAWRAFHGLLLQALAASVLTLGPTLDRFDTVLAAFSDPTASLHALQQGTARLEASAARIETTTAATQDAVAAGGRSRSTTWPSATGGAAPPFTTRA